MKRKIISLTLSVIMLGSISLGSYSTVSVHAQENKEKLTLADYAESSDIQSSTSAEEWVDSNTAEVSYPVTTDSNEWEEMNSHDEMLEVCTVPDEILESISTDELVSLVLDYPLLCDIYAYNSFQDGLQALAVNYNGIKELLNREDGAKKLLDKYTQLDILELKMSDNEINEVESIFNEQENVETALDILEQNDELQEMVLTDSKLITDVVVLETLLGQDEVLEELSDEEIETLVNTAGENYDKKENSKLYDGLEDVFFDAVEESEILDVTSTDTKEQGAVYGTGTTTVKTPKGSKVSVDIYSYAGVDWVATVTAQFKSSYPKATVLANADNRYNCHSYAWYSASTSNTYWMENPGKYMSDGSYSKVGSSPTANGQKVIWLSIPLTNPYVHSAIVVNYKDKTLKSKWGQAPLMQHSVSYSPYSANSIIYYK